jgi:hypothetical protein
MSTVPELPQVEVKERLQRFDLLLQHLHRLRANLAVDPNLPMALRELHKLQALQMLQHHRPQPHRRPNKHFHGGVLPILPPLPPLLSPTPPDGRHLPYGQPPDPDFVHLPAKQQQEQMERHLGKSKCGWDEAAFNGDAHDADVTPRDAARDAAGNGDSPVVVESDEDLEDDENVQGPILQNSVSGRKLFG